MRIAILTLRFHTNFGGILQAYALQTVLERMGHQVTVLDKVRKKPRVDIPFIIKIKRAILKYILFQHIPDSPQIFAYKIECAQNKNTWAFVDKKLHRRGVNNYNDIKETDYDAFVVGSDQVWRPKYFAGNTPSTPTIVNAFLAFTNGWNIKRIVYAASFGTEDNEYTDNELKECRDLIKNFDAVSVREISGKKMCEEYFGVKAKHVLDPTFLLQKTDYNKLCMKRKVRNGGQILVYILDDTEEKQRLVTNISSILDKKTFKVNADVDNSSAPLKKRIQYPVEQWLAGFRDADYVITDSFHACVFSIIYGKPFIVYGNKERGLSRFTSLLSTFALEDRLILSFSGFDFNKITSSIEIAQKKIESLREESFSFLKTVL